MAETMEQYISKTRADYGSGVARPKIDDKDHFELKCQFLKELRDNTFSSLDHKDANEHIEKVLEIVDLFHFPNITQDQEKGFGSLPSSTETNLRDHVKSISTTVEANMTPICPTIPFLSRLNDYYYDEKKRSYGPQFLEAYLYGASHINDFVPRKEKDPGIFTLPCYINNVCIENALADLGTSISVMPLSTYLNLGLGELVHTKLTVELADRIVKHPKGIAENVLVGIGKFIFPIDFIILDMPEGVKVPLIFGKPFLSTTHTKIDVFKRKITLRVGEEKIIFKSVKPASSLIKRVYMLSLRERMELDLEARLMGETLVLNRSLDPLYGDYIELNDLNVPLELRRDQVDDLLATVEEGEVVDKHMIEEVKTWNNNEMVSKNFGYPSDYNQDEKIRIDCAYNLKFSCMIVVKDMDPYFDEGMGEVVVGEPFCKVSCVETRRFDGIITIHDMDESLTYQMVSPYSVSRFMDTTYWFPVQDLVGKKSTILVKYLQPGILAH
ncbi:gag-pol polyprotein [Tanacetum coccineum]